MTRKYIENKILIDDLEAFSEHPAQPPAELMARVLADALATQADFAPPRSAPARPGFWREFFSTLGGWPAMAGLTTAAVAGVWLGAFPPAALPDATSAYLGLEESGYLVDIALESGFDIPEGAL